ncbi:unnamed protein product, partial [Rotaria sp. Silwood2]
MLDQAKMEFSTTSDATVEQSKTNATITGGSNQLKDQHINETIRKHTNQIVDKYNIEDITSKCNASKNNTVTYCRCWKSKKV